MARPRGSTPTSAACCSSARPFSLRGGRAARAASAWRPGRSRRARAGQRPTVRRDGPDAGCRSCSRPGMSPLDRDRRGRSTGCARPALPLAVLQCTTAYPCPPEKVGLNLIADVSRAATAARSASPTTPGPSIPALAAATLGAEVLEVHVTLSREMFGPDVPSSVTTAELRAARARACASSSACTRHPVDKERPAAEAAATARTLHQERRRAAWTWPRARCCGRSTSTSRSRGPAFRPRELPQLVGRRLRRRARGRRPAATSTIWRATVNGARARSASSSPLGRATAASRRRCEAIARAPRPRAAARRGGVGAARPVRDGACR